jgi:DNA-binding response OmpR family regulator
MNKTILIADNETEFRANLQEKLERAGYTTAIVASGSGVVGNVLEANPDMVLLSLDIEGRDGLEIIQDLKTRDETRATAVIAISESGDPMEVEKAREAGADDFLIRAIFDPDEVLQKLSKVTNAPIDPSVHVDDKLSETAQELEDVLADVEIPQSPPAGSAKTKAGKAGTVMIIEDDKFLREDLYGRKLRAAGFTVESAEDGDTAFRMLATMIPDIVILDLVLPGMDGFEILQKIREGEKTKDVPVIIVSNLGQQEDVDKAMELGATDFMVKANFTLDEIASRIRSIIGKK